MLETKVKLSKNNPDDMEPEELVDEYASLDAVKKKVEGRAKQIRESVEKAVEKKGSFNGSSSYTLAGHESKIELQLRNKVTIDAEGVVRMCKRRNILIGKMNRMISKKNDDPIPDDILAALDKYFVIKEDWVIGKEDLENAVTVGLISQADADKHTTVDKTKALKASLAKGAEDSLLLP